jgi:predicted DNA-binding transcriptional regulator AlpA
MKKPRRSLSSPRKTVAQAEPPQLRQSRKPPITPRFLTLQGAVAYTGLSIRSLYYAIAKGEFKVAKNGGRTIVERAELDRWLDSRNQLVEIEG